MNFIERTIGKGGPSVAIVGSMHGDEKIGERVIARLRGLELEQGTVSFINAHPEALKKHVRFIERDLNRSFPGKKNGVIEEQLAFKLKRHLRGFDVVIDLHTTRSDIGSLIIFTRDSTAMRELLGRVPIKKVALIGSHIFGGHEMVNHTPLGISLEYGPDTNGKSSVRAARDIKALLVNLGMVAGRRRRMLKKVMYTVSGRYEVKGKVRPKAGLRDFRFIKKGQSIGSTEEGNLKARYSFYPLFLGRGRYEGTFALAAKTKQIVQL